MQIGALSSIAPTMPVLNPVIAGKSAAVPLPSPAASPVAAKASSSTPTTRAAPARQAAPARSSHAHSSPSAGAGSSAAEEMDVSSYSTTIAGKQYSGSVEESGGQYTASVPNLAGATASGSSLAAAENNLDLRIDELV